MNRLAQIFPLSAERGLRTWLLLAILIAITQLSDPLQDPSTTQLLIFWFGRIVGFILCFSVSEYLVREIPLSKWQTPAWLKPVIVVSAIALLPLTLIEMGLESVAPQKSVYDDSALQLSSPILAFIAELLTILTVLLPMNLGLWFVIDQRSIMATVSDSAMKSHPDPPFLKKTSGLRVQDVLAIEADEHYIRVYADDSSELIHHRLRDAIFDMPDTLGLQVHRSWWLADRAVLFARRAGKRHRIELVNGLDVPVSDSFLDAVRQRGFLRRKKTTRS